MLLVFKKETSKLMGMIKCLQYAIICSKHMKLTQKLSQLDTKQIRCPYSYFYRGDVVADKLTFMLLVIDRFRGN